MIEATITAEDLTLFALNLLEGDEQAQVEAMLRRSTAAREELANIRGDLALFALAAEQHTPPALTRQRLLKQVARERRTVPVELPVQDDGGQPGKQVFGADRSAEERVGRSGETNATSGADRPRQQPRPASAPVDQQSPNGAPALQVRTFPSRSQQLRAAAAQATAPPVPRVIQEPQAFPPDPSGTFSTLAASAAEADFAGEQGGFAGDPRTFAADRQTFSPDPQVFPREARSLTTSATAHSVTMFEQHFATEAAPRVDTELPPDPEAYSGRRRKETVDTVAESVQDRFVPSGAPETNFGFSSYRDYEVQEPRSSGFGRWMGWAGWAVAGAVGIAALVALRDDFSLREQVSQQQSLQAASETSAAKAETVMQTLQSPASQHFLLGRTDAAPGPSGRVAYLPERGTLVFQGNNLETLQPYKTYELWLIPAGEGRQPVPAGLFKPDGHGYATVVLPQLTKGVIAGNFGVTIEDEGGSATPTLPIVLVAAQS